MRSCKVAAELRPEVPEQLAGAKSDADAYGRLLELLGGDCEASDDDERVLIAVREQPAASFAFSVREQPAARFAVVGLAATFVDSRRSRVSHAGRRFTAVPSPQTLYARRN